ncbi:MAG: ferrous iron transport protein B [Lentisphaerae bacterium]|nr:ferrous iron transport protein B [Lentisphaerota bacterium]
MPEFRHASVVTVAVAGNPNAGKTTLFNLLTGSNQTVGNYPGVTVEKKEGWAHWKDQALRLTDLPGTYSLTAYSQEEVVARDAILDGRPDVVLDVVDASNLERNLYLAMQLAEIGCPLVIALNMHDVAVQRGLRLDLSRLSRWLGVPVVPTVGHRGEGREELLEALVQVARGAVPSTPQPAPYGARLDEAVDALSTAIAADAGLAAAAPPRWLAVKLLEEDAKAVERVQQSAAAPEPILTAARQRVDRFIHEEGEDPASLIAERRYGQAAGIVRGCVTVADHGATLTDAVDTIVCNRYLGFIIVALVVFIAFKLTFQLADGWTYVPWFDGWTTPVGACTWFFEELLPRATAHLADGPLRSLLEHGLIAGVGGVMSFVPLIFFMFLVLAAIEDSGYVARIAFVLDRILRSFGLQGKSILALIVSGGIAGGCAVPGVMATRTLREEKDRLVTMLVAPLMNCGAKMPVFAMIIAGFFSRWKGEMMWFLAALSWVFALGAAFVLRRFVVRGEQTPFVMELPPYHLPVLRHILRSALERSWMYIRKAGTIILAVSILLWAAMVLPRLDPAPYDARRLAVAEALQADIARGPADTLVATADEAAALLEMAQRRRAGEAVAAAPDDLTPDLAALLEQALPGPADAAVDDATLPAAALALRHGLEAMDQIERDQQADQLRNSLAGRLGRACAPAAALAGFEWRDTIALFGGLAAKEVILSTLGMAYSMDRVHTDGEGEIDLGSALRQAHWSPLRAFAFLVFVMLYAPCAATVVAIGRESGSWRWAAFSVLYSTGLAWIMATLVYQVGIRIGL